MQVQSEKVVVVVVAVAVRRARCSAYCPGTMEMFVNGLVHGSN